MVCFKYRENVDAAAQADHRRQLAALASVPGVVDLKVGEDIVHAARSYDTGLLVVFADRAALDAYQKHDRHVPVSQLGVSLAQHIVSVDFMS